MALSLAKAFSMGLKSGLRAGREGGQARAGGLDRGADAGPLVAAEVVHGNDVAGPQFGHEDLVHASLESDTVDRSVEHHGRDHAGIAQGGDEDRRLPVAVRDGGAQPFTAR